MLPARASAFSVWFISSTHPSDAQENQGWVQSKTVSFQLYTDDMLLIPEISNILTAVFQHYVYGRRILIAWLVKTAVPSPP